MTDKMETRGAPERCPTCTSSVRNIKAGLAYGVLEPGACPDIWHDGAATQEQPAGSGAQAEQASAKLKCGCQPIHSTECVFRDVRSSQYRHFYEFEKAGSPR